MTTLDLIKAALRRTGSLGQGETPNASEQADALLVLNNMVDLWSTDGQNIINIAEFNANLAQGVQTYMIGPGGAGEFQVTRPIRIQAGAVIYNGYRWPLDLIGSDQWSAVIQRTAAGSLPYQLFDQYSLGGTDVDRARWAALFATSTLAGLPWQLYDDYNFPTSNLNLWPIPNVACTLNLLTWQALSVFALDNTQLTFPPGYLEALRTNLALKLCEEFGMAIPPGLPGEAQQAMAAMRQMNLMNDQMMQGQRTAGPMRPQPIVPAPPAPAPQQ